MNQQSVQPEIFPLHPRKNPLLIRGADISSLKKSEDMGGVYYDRHGNPKDALSILREYGLNFARLRVWANSPDGYHGKSQLLDMAKRLEAHGIKLLVDFHYSDSWADPGKQYKPKAWESFNFEELQQAVYEHTLEFCSALQEQGTPPAMVQIGNEIENGMLWPEGHTENGFEGLAALLKAGIRAVREISPDVRIMLHLSQGGKNDLFRWWFDGILAQGIEFDLIGVSFYPYWHGTLMDLQHNLNDLAQRYQKDVIVVETAYPFTLENGDHTENVISADFEGAYPPTPAGQKQMLADVIKVISQVPNEHGLGFFWWDAVWTAVPGNGWDPANPETGNNWENQALFDYNAHPLPALELFGGV
ncbi:MAG: arabinogalactan endo-1,4-beta-galactosidase [Anaerolineales bacterium]